MSGIGCLLGPTSADETMCENRIRNRHHKRDTDNPRRPAAQPIDEHGDLCPRDEQAGVTFLGRVYEAFGVICARCFGHHCGSPGLLTGGRAGTCGWWRRYARWGAWSVR